MNIYTKTAKTTPAWEPTIMKHRYFWGMPHTETDIAAFKATLVGRAEAVAAGRHAAAMHMDKAVERLTRRSTSLLVVDLLFMMMIMLLGYKVAADATPLFMQLTRWGFGLALVSSVILMSNLGLVWASDAARHYGDPDTGFEFAMNIYKGRAWRYTLALMLSFIGLLFTAVAVFQFK